MKQETHKEQIDHLVEEYLPYAEALAKSMWSRMSRHMELDEALSLARMGLVEAARKFDPARKVAFKTFAYYRIRGAIYDGVRSMAPLSREQAAAHRFQKGMDLYMETHVTTRGTGGRNPDLAEFRHIVGTMTSVYLLSLDTTLEHVDVADNDGINPHQAIEKSEAIRNIRRLIGELTDQEQTIIRMYYYQNRTLDEIGQELNLSRSWVCRMHARILQKLQRLHDRNGLTHKQAFRA